jgi:hypothetical protein
LDALKVRSLHRADASIVQRVCLEEICVPRPRIGVSASGGSPTARHRARLNHGAGHEVRHLALDAQ